MRLHHIRLIASVAIIGLFATGCNNNPSTEKNTVDTTATSSVATPKPINFSLLAEYPHDNTAFTEGLEYIDGYLYESAGKYGQSDIRKTDLKSGKVLQSQKLDAKYFGEGITVFNGKIYQLTYQEKTGFVYDFKTMKLLQTFSFPNDEGWGMTHDSVNLIYSDGTDKIFFMDPNTFKEVRHIEVKDQYGQLFYINELEYIHGYIYANQWKTDTIYKIDPATGNVIGIANMKDLRIQGGIPEVSNNENAPEVMNGIAYDAANNRILITGKNWPKIFEVQLDN
jgi:glutamine cyclotransferase